MKLRKALDKAKIERQDTEPAVQETTPSSIPQFRGEIEQREGWKAPVYSESKSVELNPETLAEHHCVCIFPDAPEIEAYKVLRTQIQQRTKAQGRNTIMITSVGPGEGKTVTSINLAITFAKEFNQTVLLVDGDLKKQQIHDYLGYESSVGLGDYLLDKRSLAELITWPGIEKLTIISGGKKVQDSTELLNSPRMRDLVKEMKNRYEDRYIFFDVPHILGSADAIAFAPMVDSLLLVVESGKTSMADIKRALELIPKDKFLGFILNRQKKE